MKLVVDLDDTLISSTHLNNDAYNFAIEKLGYKRIETKERITRANFAKFDRKTIRKIIKLKQKYFLKPWVKYRVVINYDLLEVLKFFGRSNCYLWTASSKLRAKRLLKIFGITKYFKKLIFDKKLNYISSLKNIKKIIKTDDFAIYENNYTYFEKYNYKLLHEIKNNIFDVACFKCT